MEPLKIFTRVLMWLILIHFIGGFSLLGEGINGNVNKMSLQDSIPTNFEAEWQDTSDISNDSLEKMVPYLDEVEADSKNDLLVLYILAIILASFMSEDLACIGAGMMVANGVMAFWPAAFGAIAGIYIGDFTLYFAGRFLGRSIFTVVPFKWFITEETVNTSVRWFNAKGPYLLFASRFIPGSRFPIYLTAGILKTSFWKFVFYFGLTVLIWTPIFVWISVFAGNEIFTLYEKYDDYAVFIAIGAVVLLFLLYKVLLPLFTVQGRRLVWSRIRKLFNR